MEFYKQGTVSTINGSMDHTSNKILSGPYYYHNIYNYQVHIFIYQDSKHTKCYILSISLDWYYQKIFKKFLNISSNLNINYNGSNSSKNKYNRCFRLFTSQLVYIQCIVMSYDMVTINIKAYNWLFCINLLIIKYIKKTYKNSIYN
eukprot:555870_1